MTLECLVKIVMQTLSERSRKHRIVFTPVINQFACSDLCILFIEKDVTFLILFIIFHQLMKHSFTLTSNDYAIN